MTCGFATIRYSCKHNQLLKVECTEDCADFCESTELVLAARCQLPCIDCLSAAAKREHAVRYSAHEEENQKIDNVFWERPLSESRHILRKDMQQSAGARLAFHAQRQANMCQARKNDVQDVERWCGEYADVLFQHCLGGEMTMSDLKCDLDFINDIKPEFLEVLEQGRFRSMLAGSDEEQLSNSQASRDVDALPAEKLQVDSNGHSSLPQEASMSPSPGPKRPISPPLSSPIARMEDTGRPVSPDTAPQLMPPPPSPPMRKGLSPEAPLSPPSV